MDDQIKQPSQQRQILAKLDEHAVLLSNISIKISSLEMKVEMQPKVDGETFKSLDNKIYQNAKRIQDIEESQKWLVRTMIGLALATFVQIVMSLANL